MQTGTERQTVPAMLAESAAARGDAPALHFHGETRNWDAFYRRVCQVANGLNALGVYRNDKTAMLAYNSATSVEAYLGAICAGGCTVPLSGMATPEQLQRMIVDCDARILVVGERMRHLVEPYLHTFTRLLPGGLFALDFEAEGWTAFEPWLAQQDIGPNGLIPEETDDFNIIYSSGTTGTPKGILHDHGMREFQITRMARLGLDGDAVALVSTPIYSNTTLVSLIPAIVQGGQLVIMDKFRETEFLELAEKYRVTHAMLVPVQYQRLLEHPDFDRYDLSSFKVKLSTSAPLRRDIKQAALERWPGNVVEIYGLTEGGGSSILNCGEFPDKLHTVGKPAEGTDIRVIDEEGRELPRGEIGEIVGRSRAMMKAYYGRPDLTEAMYWHSPDGELFYRSGDMGRIDRDGFIELLDRRKDMIISGGFNIYATDLEQALLEHPAVRDAAVIGVPSKRWGETPVALAVSRGGVDEEELRAWANARLGKGQQITALKFTDELPRSVIGKIMKRELRESFLRDYPDAVQ